MPHELIGGIWERQLGHECVILISALIADIQEITDGFIVACDFGR